MSPRNLLRVNQFLEKHSAFTNGQIRWLIFNSKTNGLDEAGVIVRLPRRVFIDEDRFFEWLDAQNQRTSSTSGDGSTSGVPIAASGRLR